MGCHERGSTTLPCITGKQFCNHDPITTSIGLCQYIHSDPMAPLPSAGSHLLSDAPARVLEQLCDFAPCSGKWEERASEIRNRCAEVLHTSRLSTTNDASFRPLDLDASMCGV